MKKNIITKYKTLLTALFVFAAIAGCKEEFLDPEPLSFYTPDNALNDADGMYALLSGAHRRLRAEWYGDGAPIITENIFSEVAVEGTTDKSGPAQDLNLLITPDANLNSADRNRIGWFWNEFYENIKLANTVVTRLDNAEYESEEERNAVLGTAFFHRAYAYYRLTQQFGDVPLLLEELTTPKLDFVSTARLTILDKMKDDLEYAAQWVPAEVAVGEVSKGAVNHLLAKVNLARADFDGAIAAANAVINGPYALMTERFGVDKDDPSKNVIWDLHRPENKSFNTEGILMSVSRLEFDGNGSATSTSAMRQAVPLWWRFINTPDGFNGMSDNPNAEIPHVLAYGRGIGRNRGVPYSTIDIWKDDDNDLRHAPGNWVDMEDITYNAPSLKDNGSTYYDKPLELKNASGVVLCSDTIRNWYGWPQYKLFIPDPTASKPSGGHSDWYIFRLAETYLLRAEAYFWKADLGSAADDINMVRSRAQAANVVAGDVNIDLILDERARELYYEEPRNTELTRIAFIFAMTGKAAYNGKTYSMNDFHQNNFWYDRIMETTNFYNKGVFTIHGDEYTMSPYHALYPVPASSINGNTQGVINQNLGYPGSENNIPPATTLPEGS